MTAHPVSFAELVRTLQHQGLSVDDFRPGDVVIVRFGYLAQYESMDDAKRQKLDEWYKTHKPDNIGLQPSKELLEFLWSKKIAAIAGDTWALEVWPCTELDWHLHEWLLAGWGMPIGELFYLEEMAKICKDLGRWTFFLSSSPMNVSRDLTSGLTAS